MTVCQTRSVTRGNLSVCLVGVALTQTYTHRLSHTQTHTHNTHRSRRLTTSLNSSRTPDSVIPAGRSLCHCNDLSGGQWPIDTSDG